jgi:hypothetical protein
VISSSFVTFLDINDNVRKIRALSLMDRDYFRALLETAGRMVDGKFVGSLYDEDTAFRNVVNAILLLCGLSPFWVDSEIVVRLLFGVGDEPAILLQLNFPQPHPSHLTTRRMKTPLTSAGLMRRHGLRLSYGPQLGITTRPCRLLSLNPGHSLKRFCAVVPIKSR